MAFGLGIIRNIEEAYSFLMENYQEGDRVFLFGFSRGAYTARALAAYIYRFGIFDSGCQNLIPYATKLFRSRPIKWNTIAQFKETYGRNCSIHYLGLWDSVKTFGWIYNPIFLPNTTQNPCIRYVRHAIAIDERRAFFQKMLWKNKKPKRQDLKQVWFAGVHGDIGGGYPEAQSGLAKIPLKWMIDESRELGLHIKFDKYKDSVLGEDTTKYVKPNPLAKLHDSLTWPWLLIQYLPRVMWDPEKQKPYKAKTGGRVLKFPDRIRKIPAQSTLHISVLERLKIGQYQPINLRLKSFDSTHIQEELLEQGYSFEPPLIGSYSVSQSSEDQTTGYKSFD